MLQAHPNPQRWISPAPTPPEPRGSTRFSGTTRKATLPCPHQSMQCSRQALTSTARAATAAHSPDPERENTAIPTKLALLPAVNYFQFLPIDSYMSIFTPGLRTPVMTLVDASWEDPNGDWQTITARMEDKSAGGACV